jgi:hypothetical protein
MVTTLNPSPIGINQRRYNPPQKLVEGTAGMARIARVIAPDLPHHVTHHYAITVTVYGIAARR